ncbi:hypothetical protein [Oceanobacillus iheyensis HTE831]|uniref:Gfo/Idh/MocA-like oxidoreductase N-terminal domain-containing protein n=1 Tax=Oceanobacillus iheyensis (strain DSM 14371 / CIP 107618 / JCM 11309 / KCTC 3954 / HTE831) TaxID=221109 RepID=Q8EKW2_OCEIH|nr:hypothetical protein [Oceanobacillus iheyensis HTE831]
MKDIDIDAIIVTTSTNLHTEIILKACQYKKHIFTEKVLALSVEENEEIWKAKMESEDGIQCSVDGFVTETNGKRVSMCGRRIKKRLAW